MPHSKLEVVLWDDHHKLRMNLNYRIITLYNLTGVKLILDKMQWFIHPNLREMGMKKVNLKEMQTMKNPRIHKWMKDKAAQKIDLCLLAIECM